ARAGLSPVLYTGPQPGGQLITTNDVENYPGYPEGRMGPEMMEDFRKQAERFDTSIRNEMINKVDFTGPVHKAWSESGHEIHASTVIIATGASAKWLRIPGEHELENKGVSACAVCDGFFYRRQKVAVVGGGDTAAEEATYLSKICSEVHLIVRRDEMRASKIMQERVLNTPNITVHWNSAPVEVLGTDGVEGVRLQDTKTGEERVLEITGFFVAIGHKPNTDVFNGWITLDDTGYIVTQPGRSFTNIPGVFACGDVQDRIYRQAVTAAGSGCMAALDAERYLVEHGM
ncbi:MAG: thioredoxin-disulfide reductase, partial [Bacteroidota bacterium]